MSTVIVTRDYVASNPVTVNVSAAAPDILIYGSARAVAFLPDGNLNGPSHPAAPGTYLVVYFTGVGAVNQSVSTGAASPSNPPAQATGNVQSTIGGKAAKVAFLGLARTFVGLGQANIQVPSGLSAGDHPLVISIDGNASNSAVVSLK